MKRSFRPGVSLFLLFAFFEGRFGFWIGDVTLRWSLLLRHIYFPRFGILGGFRVGLGPLG
jgi:hypothetical protein